MILESTGALRGSSSFSDDDHEEEEGITVKNSFIHFGDRSCWSSRCRRSSAPVIVRTSEYARPILADHVMQQEEEALLPPSGDIFYSVFVSPACERGPAKLPSGTTTVMVRNIPTRFTSVSFLRVLDECGFRNTYSFFYLPMDFRTGKNMGYCFINFLHASFTVMFASLFHGRRLRMTTSTKVIEISPSKRQGLSENVALFRASDLLGSLSLPHFKPLVLVSGVLRPLSEKTFAAVMTIH